ncbi:hypothetical protein ABZV64_28600 [Streptomyces sp. NPDC004959]|uniref:hypothetical protein n=1 Tax=unclassified Streptomyces TaxID=2593676 RepID=UPI0004C82055|nr:hypothetical protein [Streptomyces sp. NRRL F-5630]
MSLADREEARVRDVLAGLAVPLVPAGLAAEAARRGRRTRLRRARLRRAGWVLLCCAVLVFAVWAARARPWAVPEEVTTPSYPRW